MDNWITGPLVLVRWGSARAEGEASAVWRLQRGAGARGHHGGHGPGANGSQDLLGPATKWRCFSWFLMGKYGKNRWKTSGTCGNFVFFGFWWEKRWNMMGKDLEHVVKRLRVSMVLMGKNVEACGSLRWSNVAMGNFRTKWRCYRTIIYQWWIFQPFWSDYQRRNPNSIQF